MAVPFDPYSILGIPRSASDEDVKKAYRKLAQRLHPDKNQSLSASLQFQDINSAYNLLLDISARKAYDSQTAQSENNGDTYFTLRVTPSKRAVIPLDEEQIIYLLAEIFPAPQPPKEKKAEANINICLVLDVSNSMKGTRIDRVKIAAQRIIDSLTENDVISVVAFNDRATTVIPATKVTDKANLRARISMISTGGGTEIYQGLNAGVQQASVFASQRSIDSVILLTDGHTFGDQESCINLAKEALDKGIVISAMGLGHDWNDEFLDKLASITGGSSVFINSADIVVKFLNEHIRSLSNSFADRMQLTVAPDSDIKLEMAFRLSPNPQPLSAEGGVIPLSSLQINRPIALLLQFVLPPKLAINFRTLARLVVSGEILQNVNTSCKSVSDVSIEVTNTSPSDEPPSAIMDALSKLTLYRLQERAKEALERGDIEEATRKLNHLATRLLEMGQGELAKQTLSEAQKVSQTKTFSDIGRKTIKYQTRALLGTSDLDSALTNFISPSDS